MMNSKLQAALDEIERLCDTVKEYKKRNGQLPHADSDAGRAVYSLQQFQEALSKFDMAKVLER
jgi:FtsZ-binding cell division protein ZapB